MVSAGMFEGAAAFNQPILFQHTEKVTSFASMRRSPPLPLDLNVVHRRRLTRQALFVYGGRAIDVP